MRGITQSDYYKLTAEKIVNREHEAWRQQLRRDDLLRRIAEFEADMVSEDA